MSKIKKYYPEAGSSVIVDKRGIGFTLYSVHDHYLIDPALIRNLVDAFLTHKKFSFSAVVADPAAYITSFLEAHDDFIRGNTFPVSRGEGAFAVISTKALRSMNTLPDLRDVDYESVSYVMAHVMSGFKLVEVEQRQAYHGVYYRGNPLMPMVSKLSANMLLTRIMMTDVITRALKVLFAQIEAAEKVTIKADRGGYRSASVTDLALSISRALADFDGTVRSARTAMRPIVRAFARVLFYARRHANEYVPANMTVTDVAKMLKYANSFFYLGNVEDKVPTITEEALAKKCLEKVEATIACETSGYEVIPTSTFQGLYKQVPIRLSYDSVQNQYLKTSWMLPGVSAPQAATIIPFDDVLASVTMDGAMADSFTWVADGLMSMRAFFESEWDSTARSVDGYTTEEAISRDLDAISVYDADFVKLMQRALAIDLCHDFDLGANNSLITFEYVDYLIRHTYGAVTSSTQRYSRSTDPVQVIIHTSMPSANEQSAFKHPNVLPLMPAATNLVRGITDLETTSADVTAASATGSYKPLHRIAGTVDMTGEGFVSETPDAIAFTIITPKGETKSVNIILADLVDSDIFAIADTYLELGSDYAFTSAYIKRKASEVLALSEGVTKRDLARGVFVLLGRFAETKFSGLILDALRKYVVMPPQELEDRMSREMTINKRRNAISAYLAVLKYLGLDCASELKNIVDYATANLSQTELAGE